MLPACKVISDRRLQRTIVNVLSIVLLNVVKLNSVESVKGSTTTYSWAFSIKPEDFRRGHINGISKCIHMPVQFIIP